VVATAKRDLAAGEVLDGEGGETIWGRLMPAGASLAEDGLPIALAHDVRLVRPVAAGARVSMADVRLDEAEQAVALRRSLVQSVS
jgi:predicted homoserine dehydrogenase-like protein